MSYKPLNETFNIVLRLHISEINAESMLRLAKKIKNELLDDSRFHIDIQKIKNLGDSVKGSVQQYVAINVDNVIKELEDILTKKSVESTIENTEKGGKSLYLLCIDAQTVVNSFKWDSR